MASRFLSAIRRPVLNAATWAYGRVRAGGTPRRGLRILTYHAIGTPIEGDLRLHYSIEPARFETHMRYVSGHFQKHPVPLGCPPQEDDTFRVAVTFDDGYRDNIFSVAAPLMDELGIPFTVSVCTGAVAQRRSGFPGTHEVRERAGVPVAAIGSHTIGHPRLAECDERRLKEDLSGSKAYLEDLPGKGVDSIAYSHGRMNRLVRDMAESAGYLLGASTRFDINLARRDPLPLCRTDIWTDDVPTFGQKMRGDWDGNRRRSADPGSCA